MSRIDRISQRETEQLVMQAERITPSASLPVQESLLSTKFFVPVASHVLISRNRLNALLDESFKYPLTLVSAPAGFGKTTLAGKLGAIIVSKGSVPVLGFPRRRAQRTSAFLDLYFSCTQ